MKPDFNPLLQDNIVTLQPLTESDFDSLFAVASDAEIWEQHPYKDRWKKEVYREFFDKSLQSNGAFKIIDRYNGNIIGGTRFYEYNVSDNSVAIGGTFFAKNYWGTGINKIVKKLMLDHIFTSVVRVYFYIDQHNKRSQIAIERLGATKCGEKAANDTLVDFVYTISKEDWTNQNTSGQ